ncbi:unnamed protein product [Heligmosomoides polygyrus]|uniref:BLOC-1-related complex subunit 5 n=1 Tax=Heligmosomoides polygyrus TaxID=6339 RepID=A0A3P8BMP3_HELPZ|nr:unnamed protein product [Heligmosomoides polygyrus]
MGNEQSASSSSPQPSSNSTFAFLSGRGTSVKKSKGIVVVSGGAAKVERLEDDEVYKRFLEIPRFLPILRHAIGKKDVPPSELPHKLSSRPLFRMATRFQHHLKVCANTVAADQSQINAAVKSVEADAATVTSMFSEKKKAADDFVAQLQTLDKLRDDVLHVQLLLEHIVPMAETLNELLVPSERLPPLALSRVLDRTPVSTSASSSQHSTPRHLPAGGSSSHPRIAPIEEVRVVDRSK